MKRTSWLLLMVPLLATTHVSLHATGNEKAPKQTTPPQNSPKPLQVTFKEQLLAFLYWTPDFVIESIFILTIIVFFMLTAELISLKTEPVEGGLRSVFNNPRQSYIAALACYWDTTQNKTVVEIEYKNEKVKYYLIFFTLCFIIPVTCLFITIKRSFENIFQHRIVNKDGTRAPFWKCFLYPFHIFILPLAWGLFSVIVKKELTSRWKGPEVALLLGSVLFSVCWNLIDQAISNKTLPQRLTGTLVVHETSYVLKKGPHVPTEKSPPVS